MSPLPIRSPRGLAWIPVVVLVSCSSPEGAHDEHAETEAGHEESGDATSHETGVVSLDGVRGVTFEPVGEPRDEGAWFAAEAISDPGAETALSTPVAGTVTALRAAPGDAVARGATVVELTSPELADLVATWRSAGAERERAERELVRERRLLAGEATAPAAVEAAEADAAVAAAKEESARLALTGRGVSSGEAGALYRVRAQRSGVVSSLEVALGEAVESGRRLGTIVAPGAALARVELPQPGPTSWERGARSEARRADGHRWEAIVEGTPPEVAAATRRLSYRLRLAGAELPLAGTPLEVRVPLARGIVLPQDAVQQLEGVWGVFVRDGERARFRPVRKGPELGGDVLVLEGVVPGEIVATDGAYLLKALWLKRAGGGEGHDH